MEACLPWHKPWWMPLPTYYETKDMDSQCSKVLTTPSHLTSRPASSQSWYRILQQHPLMIWIRRSRSGEVASMRLAACSRCFRLDEGVESELHALVSSFDIVFFSLEVLNSPMELQLMAKSVDVWKGEFVVEREAGCHWIPCFTGSHGV